MCTMAAGRGGRMTMKQSLGLIATPLAIVWAVAGGLACSDDAAPDEADAAAAESPAQASAAQDTAAPEATADPEPAPIPWTPGVTVVDAGKGPVPLAMEPELGTARPMVIVVEASRTPKKRGRRWPRTRMTATSTLTSASADAARRTIALTELEMTANKAFDDTVVEALRAQLPVGKDTRELVTDAMAATTTFGWPATDAASADPKTLEIGHAVAHALSHLTLPLPSEPVGRAGRIEVRRHVQLMGLRMQQTLTLKLDKLEGKQIELSGDVHYDLDPDAPPASALGIAAVTNATADGKFFLRLHRPTATPIEMNVVLDLVVSDATATEQKVWLDLRVDEDFIAMADRRVRLRGEFTQGGIVLGRVAAGTKVWFNRKKTRVSPAGDFVIGFGHKAKDRALLSFRFAGADTERHIVHVAPREFVDERIDGLPPEMVDLDRATRRALAASRKRVQKVRKKVSKEPYFAEGFRWPLRGRVTSTYGRRRFLNGDDRGPHWGVDLAAPAGKSVKAPAGGVVVLADRDVPLSGNLMIVDHGHGLTSSFLHLKSFRAEVGDVVKAGQVIATSGNSGRSTGPHLDWRMNLARAGGGDVRVDPETIVDRR